MSWTLREVEDSIPARFARVAARLATKPAIAGGPWSPSYAELDAAANWVAQEVVARTGPGSGRAALLMRHRAQLFAAAIGVMRAGKTAVVLNPLDPPARLTKVHAHTEPQLVLVDPGGDGLAARAGFEPRRVLAVASPPPLGESPPGFAADPGDAALLIFTSGTTGRPKGVIQTHRNVLHNVLRHSNGLGIGAADRISLLASLSGGQGVGTAWTALLNGATLCPFSVPERGIAGLANWIEAEGITVLIASASLFRHFARTLGRRRFEHVRLLRLASEASFRADFDAFRRHFGEGCKLASTLSATETGAIAQRVFEPGNEPSAGVLPVGRVAPGIGALLVDERGGEVAPGAVGEIVVRSRYLSPGYWRNEALTAERFSPIGNGAERLFRTGDLARASADGVLTVLGRRDSQVKVRGNRVELSEVEAAITAAPGVAGGAVRPHTTRAGDLRLTAYVAARPGSKVTAGGLRRELRADLPDHAIPSAFHFLDSLPLNPAGAVDRELLQDLHSRPASPERRSGTISETEARLARIWRAALELEHEPARDADFLELGGDSLTAAVIAAGVHDEFGIELELDAFVEHATVAAMARLVDRRPAVVRELPLVRVTRADPLPASFEQERIWARCPRPRTSSEGIGAAAARIAGPLDVAALRRSVERIVRRHEALRTTFATDDGGLVQVPRPAGTVDLPVVDLRGAADPAALADRLLLEEAGRPLDLVDGPLVRLKLVRIADREHRLLRVSHHIVCDALSWSVFFDELGLLYEADVRGEPPPLAAELPLQHADFAAWERRHLHPGSPRFREGLAWWRDALAAEATAPPPLPSARPSRYPDARPSEALVWWGLAPEVSQSLNDLGRELGATYFMVRLALFAAQLAAETDDDDVALMSVVSRRPHAAVQAAFGPFVNPTVIRLRATSGQTFLDWLARARTAAVEASAHSDLPFAEVMRELAADGVRPRVRAFFGESHHLAPRAVGDLDVIPLKWRLAQMPHGFAFRMHRQQESDRCYVQFDACAHDPILVRAFVSRFQRFAAVAAADPDRPVRDLVRAADTLSGRWRTRARRMLRF